MKRAKIIGNYGEKAAEKFLKNRGWRILSTNFKSAGGEIDLIGYRFGTLVYFEVKTRSNNRYGAPADAVDAKKMMHIKSAAADFKRTYCRGKRVSVFYPFGIELKRRIYKERIDIIEVYLSQGEKTEINHIKDRETGYELY